MLSTRRRVLLGISQLIAAGSLAACGGSDESAIQSKGIQPEATTTGEPESDMQLLAGVAFDLFPFEDLDPRLYVTVAERVLSLDSPAVAQGLAMLRENNRTTHWLDVNEVQRIELLGLLERSAFFTTMRATAIEVLFRDKAVFDLVGYGGSAIEQGGYINRGFADINWLPEGN